MTRDEIVTALRCVAVCDWCDCSECESRHIGSGTCASKDYEKAKAVSKVCCAVMDKAVKSPLDVEVVVRCKDCKHRFKDSWCEYADDDDNFYCARGERKEGAE